jgi:hypothetical protein
MVEAGALLSYEVTRKGALLVALTAPRREPADRSSLRADSLQPDGDSLAAVACVMFTGSTETRPQELQRLCLLSADRAQEDDEETGVGRTWQCPLLWIADESADMAISTRMTPRRNRPHISHCTDRASRMC